MRLKLLMLMGGAVISAMALSSCVDSKARADLRFMADSLESYMESQYEEGNRIANGLAQLETVVYDQLHQGDVINAPDSMKYTGPNQGNGPPQPPCLLPPCPP